MQSRKSRSSRMGSEQQGWGGGQPHRRKHQEKAKGEDVYAELSQAGYEAAHVLALKERMSGLRERLEALERGAEQGRIRHNKLVLRELVKEARARIVEANGIPAPTSKQTWRFCLGNLSAAQLERANVKVELWPDLVAILSPSAVKLNDWVHGYSTWQAARVILGMEPAVQAAWGALFQVTHPGQSFQDFASAQEPSMADELHDPDGVESQQVLTDVKIEEEFILAYKIWGHLSNSQ